MEHIDRREVLLGSGAASGALLLGRGFASAAEIREQLIPWADQPPPVPPPAQAVVKTLTPWENLDSWITLDRIGEPQKLARTQRVLGLRLRLARDGLADALSHHSSLFV